MPKATLANNFALLNKMTLILISYQCLTIASSSQNYVSTEHAFTMKTLAL